MELKNYLELGSIQPPQNLAVLQKSFSDFDTLLGDVDDIISPVYKLLDDLLPILEFPQDLNKAINELEELLLLVEAATSELIAIPIVGEVVAGVDEAIDEIIEVVKDVQEGVIQPVIDFCTPVEKAIKEIEKPLKEIDGAIKSLEAAITKWGAALDVIQEALALAAGIGNAFDAAGQKAVAKVFASLVDAYNTVVDDINKPLKIINTAMGDINTVLNPVAKAMKKLDLNTFNKIGDIMKEVDKVLTTLNPLNDFLNHIHDVIKPFEWVLDKAGHIINKILGPILKPLLQPLEKKIMSVIGFPPGVVAALKATTTDTGSSSTTQSGSNHITSGQSTVNSSQSKLESTMSEFVSGNINTICHNLLAIIQKNSK